MAIVLIATSAAIEVAPHVDRAAPRPAFDIETLPETIDGWTARSLAFDNGFLGSLWFHQRIFRSYERAQESVRVFIGHEDLSRLDRSGYSPKTAIPGSGWHSIDRLPAGAVESAGFRLENTSPDLLVARYPQRRTLVVHWRIGFAPWGRYLVQRWLGLDYLARREDRSSPLVIRIETDVRTGDDERGWMILRQFAKRVEEWSVLSLDPPENAQ